MSRRSSSVSAAVLAGVALLAVLVVPCPCPPAAAEAHACCAPPAGVRAADFGCCDTSGAPAPSAAAAPSVAPLVTAAAVAVCPVVVPPADPVAALSLPGRDRLASPPLTVRRL